MLGYCQKAFLRYLSLLLLIATLGACEASILGADSAPIIRNETGAPIWFRAFTSEAATRAYVPYRIELTGAQWTAEARAEWERSTVSSGSAITVEPGMIEGDYRSGTPLVFYFFAIGETEATLIETLSVSAADLTANPSGIVLSN